MGPRVKKTRSAKPQDAPTSAEAEKEIGEGGSETINKEKESHEEVPETEVDNGGEVVPPLLSRKPRRKNAKKMPGNVPTKTKGAAIPDLGENADEVLGKLAEDADVGENASKVSSDNEEGVSSKKPKSRTKRTTKDEKVGKNVSSGEGESKGDLNLAVGGAKKERVGKRKLEDKEPKVMPKEKDGVAKKKLAIIDEEETTIDEGKATHPKESKQKARKRDKKQPVKKAGKNKKEQDEDENISEDDEINGKIENGKGLEKQDEDEPAQETEGGGDMRPKKATARAKAAAKMTDAASKTKVSGRGKKAKGGELSEDCDVPIDGKKLRVFVEHCKS